MKKFNTNKFNLISFQDKEPRFRNTEPSDLESINQRTFTNMKDFHPVENLKFIWEKAEDYLKKIIEKKDSKKLKKTILKIFADHLDFNFKENAVPDSDLNQKIKSSYKIKPKQP